VAALAVDVFRGVTGQGGDDLDLVSSQIIREPAVIFLLDYRQIVPVYDLRAGCTRGFDEVTKKLAQLRRAAGEIDNGRAKPANPVADAIGRRRVHHFRPPRRGVHVAMPAGLVALSADVDLQRLQTRAAKGQAAFAKFLFKAVHESTGMITRSGLCSISIPPRRQKRAPVGFGIQVAQLAQDLNAQTALADSFQRLGEDTFRAPGNGLEKVGLDLAQANQPITTVGCRAQHNVVCSQALPRLENVAGRDRRTIGAYDDHAPGAGGEGPFKSALQTSPEVSVPLRTACPAFLQPAANFVGRVLGSETEFHGT